MRPILFITWIKIFDYYKIIEFLFLAVAIISTPVKPPSVITAVETPSPSTVQPVRTQVTQIQISTTAQPQGNAITNTRKGLSLTVT